LDQSTTSNIKQEKRARNWGYEALIEPEDFIMAYKNGCKNKFDVAEYLNVTEEFLLEAIKHFQEKYGPCYKMGRYLLYFEPLGVLKKFDF
jgi:hypothetical protein